MLDENTAGFFCKKIHERLYIYKNTEGLFVFRNGNMHLIALNAQINDEIIDILPYDKNFLLIRLHGQNTFLIANNQKIINTWETGADLFLQQNNYIKGLALPGNYYVFATQRCGLVIINKKGSVVLHLNKQKGLTGNEIYDLFYDKDKNLWIPTNNGISRIHFPSAFTYFDEKNGLEGGVRAVQRHGDRLFVGTSQGLYYLKDRPSNARLSICANPVLFSNIYGISKECRDLEVIDNRLLAATFDGLFQIGNQISKKIAEGSFFQILESSMHKNIFYTAGTEGAMVFSIQNTAITKKGRLTNVTSPVRTIAETENGGLWLGSDYHGVFYVDMNDTIDAGAPVYNFYRTNGLPDNHTWIDAYNTSGGILFSTSAGLFRFDQLKSSFYPDTSFGREFHQDFDWVFPIRENQNKDLWFSAGSENTFQKTTGLAKFLGNNKNYFIYSTPFNRINDYTIEEIYDDKGGIVWFGTDDKLIRCNTRLFRNDSVKEFYTLFRDIAIGKDSAIFFTNDSLFKFPYKHNSISFRFYAPSFIEEAKIRYQYLLEGFDAHWSSWSNSNYKEYTRLQEGRYIFRVRAKNIYDQISDEAVFHFQIMPPLYRTWYAYIIYLVLIVSFIIMITKYRSYLFAQEKHKLEKIILERTDELVRQKERAEELVANILPQQTAKELGSIGKTKKKYEMVTVLFSDIQGFTKITEDMKPESLVDELDNFFYRFDEVVERLGIEKIKTIGDAYMCAGGIPQKNKTNPIDVVMAALEMQQYMNHLKEKAGVKWGIRIGIHTGPIIAGVVGSKKYSYDIWGDTVNIASRMESSGEMEQINISDFTFSLVKEFFDCRYRGRIPVKYKGEIDMFFVKGIKTELSVDGKGKEPNMKFNIKLQCIRYFDLEELILTKLEKGLPKNLYYHNVKHTIDVINQVEIIGKEENVTDEEMLLLKTAALMHDAGFLLGYDDHEILSMKMAREILPDFHYTEDQVDIVCDLINITKMPPKPTNHLEEIICDADLDYLGRGDFIPVSQNLFRELFEHKKVRSIDEWNRMQLKFIESHHYFTETAKNQREVNKRIQLEELRKMI